MSGVSHRFEGSCLFFLLDVINGECLYKKLIFLRNNSKDKSVSFLYILRKLFQLICVRSAKKSSLSNFQIFRTSFPLLSSKLVVWSLIIKN